MQHLLYRSRAVANLPAEEVFRIIEVSACNNPNRDLTGFLVFARDQFIQFLEGPEAAIDALMTDLRLDPRHRELEVLLRAPARERLLPDWRMKRIDFRPGKIDETLGELRRKKVPETVVRVLAENLEPHRAAA